MFIMLCNMANCSIQDYKDELLWIWRLNQHTIRSGILSCACYREAE